MSYADKFTFSVNLSELQTFHYIWGDENQTDIAVEECCELGQALLHMKRPLKQDMNKLIDEMGDVLISLRQMQMIYNITDEQLQERIIEKMKYTMDLVHAESDNQQKVGHPMSFTNGICDTCGGQKDDTRYDHSRCKIYR